MRSWIVKVESVGKKVERVRYADQTGGGTADCEKARRFPSNQQAHEIAGQIQELVGPRGFVTVVEVTS